MHWAHQNLTGCTIGKRNTSAKSRTSLSEALNTSATFKMCSTMMALIVMLRDSETHFHEILRRLSFQVACLSEGANVHVNDIEEISETVCSVEHTCECDEITDKRAERGPTEDPIHLHVQRCVLRGLLQSVRVTAVRRSRHLPPFSLVAGLTCVRLHLCKQFRMRTHTV